MQASNQTKAQLIQEIKELQSRVNDLKHSEQTRKLLESALHLCEQRYQALTTDQGEMVCRFKPDGTLTFVNKAYCQYFQREPQKIIGQSFYPIQPLSKNTVVSTENSSNDKENSPITFENCLIAPDGNISWLEWISRPIINKNHQIIEYQAIGREKSENVSLEHELDEVRSELATILETVLESWVLALDLRDKSSQGHSQRVTEVTLQIASAMQTPSDNLVHIRRGALLHDIGKMGVPDSILYKPASLNEDEWSIMRQHPGMAYHLLSNIHDFGPAIEIPYSHHERWDGSGYPRGLKGEEIELSARIFAIADVWDALTSDRPYRKAWNNERTLAYIRTQSGTHFDPRIVDVFLTEVGPALPQSN